MASAMASAAVRNVPPPYTVPLGPRIRPPRLLPGTKAANTDPKPLTPPPVPGYVWVQGKWRDPGSNAARDQRDVVSTKTEKAMRHATHGRNIYAYNHIRTNQVVYSLTRVMQNNKILSQLLYHGKQTVPSALRRDLWRPYFSIHFPETEAGAEAGLKAFRRLRELSTVRQLSPPPELITATEEDVQKSKKKYTPLDFKNREEDDNLRNMPVKDQILPKALRARRLMDQKASSVADAAYVLALLKEGLSPAEAHHAVLEQREERSKNLSQRATRRLNTIREKEAVKEAQILERQRNIKAGSGELGLTPHAARRIALEHAGIVAAPRKGMKFKVTAPQSLKMAQPAIVPGRPSTETYSMDVTEYRASLIQSFKENEKDRLAGLSAAEIEQEFKKVGGEAQVAQHARKLSEAVKPQDAVEPQEPVDSTDESSNIRILWADIRDATWAESWSSNVFHGELEPRAAIKQHGALSHRLTTIDGEDKIIDEKAPNSLVQGSTPHVFGTDSQSGYYQNPSQLTEKHQKWKESQLLLWRKRKIEESKPILKTINALFQEEIELVAKKAQIEPEYEILKRLTANNQSEKPLDGSGLAERGDITQKGVPQSAEEETALNLTEAEKLEVHTSMRTIQEQMNMNQRRLVQMKTNYPSLYERAERHAQWQQGLETYATFLKVKDEILSLRQAWESKDSAAYARLEQIDLALAPYGNTYPQIANINNLESNLITLTERRTQKINQLEETVEELRGKPSATNSPSQSNALLDAEELLDNERRLIRNEREKTWDVRLSALEESLTSLETSEDYQGTDIMDLIRQRVYAEQQGNTEQINSLSQDLKERENEHLGELLGLAAPKVEAKITEINADDAAARERGIEQPPPKRGFFGRIKSIFGR